ncbi:hypothetical protein BX666DRAFT_2146550, partial [Dichotomocladium elegans]
MILMPQFRWRRIRMFIYFVFAAILLYVCATLTNTSHEQVQPPPPSMPLEIQDQHIIRTTRDFPCSLKHLSN